MRVCFYLLILLMFSSCTGKGFLKQKYTHFSHGHPGTDSIAATPTEKHKVQPLQIRKKPIEIFTVAKADTALRKLSSAPLPARKPVFRKEFLPQHKKISSQAKINEQPIVQPDGRLESAARGILGLFILAALILLVILVFLFINFWISLIILTVALLLFLILVLLSL